MPYSSDYLKRMIEQFSDFHAKELRAHFVSPPENDKIRAMLREWYGPVWTKRVFGF